MWAELLNFGHLEIDFVLHIAMTAGGKRKQSWIWLRKSAHISASFTGRIFVKSEIEEFFLRKHFGNSKYDYNRTRSPMHDSATCRPQCFHYLLNCWQTRDYTKNIKKTNAFLGFHIDNGYANKPQYYFHPILPALCNTKLGLLWMGTLLSKHRIAFVNSALIKRK